MSKKLKEFKKQVRIIRKQVQIFCFACVLPCSAAFFVITDNGNKLNEDIKPTAQVVA